MSVSATRDVFLREPTFASKPAAHAKIPTSWAARVEVLSGRRGAVSAGFGLEGARAAASMEGVTTCKRNTSRHIKDWVHGTRISHTTHQSQRCEQTAFESSVSVYRTRVFVYAAQNMRRPIGFDYHTQPLPLKLLINEFNIHRVATTSFQHLLLQHLHSWVFIRGDTTRRVFATLCCSKDGALSLDNVVNSARYLRTNVAPLTASSSDYLSCSTVG